MPLFIVQEESDYCARCCCHGCHPFLVRVYHAAPTVHEGAWGCAGYEGDRFVVDARAGDGGVALTLERGGICGRGPHCYMCSWCCADEMFVHAGNARVTPGATSAADGGYLGRSVQPRGAGMCTPGINMHGPDAAAPPLAYIEGPCCYNGCIELCADVGYPISRQPGRRGEFGTIVKVAPRGVGEMCGACCARADEYEFTTGPAYASLAPDQKALLLAVFIHLDYAYYESHHSNRSSG